MKTTTRDKDFVYKSGDEWMEVDHNPDDTISIMVEKYNPDGTVKHYGEVTLDVDSACELVDFLDVKLRGRRW